MILGDEFCLFVAVFSLGGRYNKVDSGIEIDENFGGILYMEKVKEMVYFILSRSPRCFTTDRPESCQQESLQTCSIMKGKMPERLGRNSSEDRLIILIVTFFPRAP